MPGGSRRWYLGSFGTQTNNSFKPKPLRGLGLIQVLSLRGRAREAREHLVDGFLRLGSGLVGWSSEAPPTRFHARRRAWTWRRRCPPPTCPPYSCGCGPRPLPGGGGGQPPQPPGIERVDRKLFARDHMGGDDTSAVAAEAGVQPIAPSLASMDAVMRWLYQWRRTQLRLRGPTRKCDIGSTALWDRNRSARRACLRMRPSTIAAAAAKARRFKLSPFASTAMKRNVPARIGSNSPSAAVRQRSGAVPGGRTGHGSSASAKARWTMRAGCRRGAVGHRVRRFLGGCDEVVPSPGARRPDCARAGVDLRRRRSTRPGPAACFRASAGGSRVCRDPLAKARAGCNCPVP